MYSIIIPTYNRANDLHRCLDSLMNQTFKDFEVIICDDGSTDNTREIYQKFSEKLNVSYIYEENWGGPARPRNNGIKKARGEWLCFLDSDDWWYPEKLERIRQFIDDYDLIFHDMDCYDIPNKKNGKKVKGRLLTKPVFEDLMLKGNCICNSSACVRKEFIDKVGALSLERKLIAVEDFDLWLRISEFTDKFKYIPESLGAYWVGGGNISTVSIKQVKRERAVLIKHWGKLSQENKRQVLLRLFYIRARIYKKLGKIKKAKKLFRLSIGSHLFAIKLRSFVFLFK